MAFSVTFEEEDTYPRSTWQNGVFQGTRRLICDWDQRETLMYELDTWPNNRWPYNDGPSEALAYRVGVEPFGKQTNEAGRTASYNKAKLTVLYGNVVQSFDGGATFLSEWLDFYTEARELSHGIFRWTSNSGDPVRQAEAPHYALHGLVYVARFHRMTNVPNWVLSRIGTCNSNPVAAIMLGLVFGAETMLYQAPKIRTSVRLGGLSTFDVTTSYRFHPGGWNTFFREETGLWEAMYVAGGSRFKPYTPIPY